MASRSDSNHDWKVLPHGPVEPLAENLWSVSGELPRPPLPRRMIVARQSDGRLLLHGPIAMDEEGMAALAALGEIAVVYVPNHFHRIDCGRFKARFPNARVICPPGARKAVSRKVAVDGVIADLGSDPRLDISVLEGTGEREGVLTVTGSDGVTLVFNDALFNVPHLPGLAGWLIRAIGSTGGPRVTNLARVALVKDKAALRARLERLAETPRLERLVPGHGDVVRSDAAAVLRAVAAGL